MAYAPPGVKKPETSTPWTKEHQRNPCWRIELDEDYKTGTNVSQTKNLNLNYFQTQISIFIIKLSQLLKKSPIKRVCGTASYCACSI